MYDRQLGQLTNKNKKQKSKEEGKEKKNRKTNIFTYEMN